MLISIIVTVRNEAKNISTLLDSLMVQEKPFEVIVIDSNSEDDTQKIVRAYAKKYPEVKLVIKPGTRGFSRNYGVEVATGDAVAFIDGDCIANPFWVKIMRKNLKKFDIVGGNTINIGYRPFADLGRVELYYKGYDVTFPSCNLAYKITAFKKAGGFDTKFITAEDIDLNFRAIENGYSIGYAQEMIVYTRARDSFVGFFKQAFWNGVGRKQLTRKHGRLWGNYDPKNMLREKMNFWYLARMGVALLGYAACKFSNEPQYHPEPYVLPGKSLDRSK